MPTPPKKISEKSADFPKIGTKRAPFGPIYRCIVFSTQFLSLSCPTDQSRRGNKKFHRRIPGLFGHSRTFLRPTAPGAELRPGMQTRNIPSTPETTALRYRQEDGFNQRGLIDGGGKMYETTRKHLTNNPAIHTQSPTMASWGLPITKRTQSNSTPSPPKQPESGQKFSHPHRPHYESRWCLHHREAPRKIGHAPRDARDDREAALTLPLESPTMASSGLPITKRTPSNSSPSPPKQPESGQKFSHPTDLIMKAGGVYTTGKRFGMPDTLRAMCETIVKLQ